MRVREPRARLGLELVAREVLGRERQGVREVRVEVGGALAGDPVEQVEGDVVETGITQSLHRAPDVLGRRPTLQHLEQMRPERLRAERDAGDAVVAEEHGELGRDGLGVRLDRHLVGLGQGGEHVREGGGLGEGRRPAADEDGREAGGEERALPVELAQHGVRVGAVLVDASDGGDEVAVAAAVDAEREVDVQVAHARRAPGRRAAHDPSAGRRVIASSRRPG